MTNDSVDYLKIAEGLLEGEAPSSLAERRLPGYPIFLALLRTGVDLEGLVLVQQSLGLLATILGGWLGWRFAGPLGGLLCGGLLAASPAFLLFELQAMTESLSVALLAAALACATLAISGPSNRSRAFSPAGIAFGLTAGAAVLVRLDNLFPLAAVGAILVLLGEVKWAGAAAPQRSRARVRWILSLCLPTLVGLAFWTGYLEFRLGFPTWFGGQERSRLVALAIHRLLDPSLPRLQQELPGFRPADPGSIFPELLRRSDGLGGAGERLARSLRREQEAHGVKVSAQTFAHALGTYLGLVPDDGSGCQIVRYWFQIWLPAWPGSQDLALRQPLDLEAAESPLAQRAQPTLARLGRIGEAYLLGIRPWLVGSALLGGGLLLLGRLRARQLGQEAGTVALAALGGHLAGAGIHALFLVDDDRYGLPFDVVIVFVLSAALGELRARRGTEHSAASSSNAPRES